MNNHSHHPFPCLHCHPHTYIRMVQHLIERCLILHMDRDQCIKALAEHASIRPLITFTVWRELLKENKDFFQSYYTTISPSCFLFQIEIFKRPQGLEEGSNGISYIKESHSE